ncbi:unnamed protein product [Cuscuta campestris]|uniref:MENTAL domain-containing protein n=1 Tax=Cuscuta campestris TaxID=132261 RepID=A0A484LVA0_9ASTE|nr:unnamed protein product [Cuscuta campestris]
MGFSKDENIVVRWIKIVFFLLSMLISLLILSAPVVLVIADALLPSALFSASLSPATPLPSLSSLLRSYDFRSSLVDIPVVSILRSAVILFVYSLCDGPRLSRGPYLGTATACSVSSLVFLSLKAPYVFGSGGRWSAAVNGGGGGYGRAMEMGLFLCSFSLAVAHAAVAYRISCRERRKLLVYKIDIEAVSACQKGFSRYPKVFQERTKK